MPIWVKIIATIFTLGWLTSAPTMFGLNGNYNHDYYVCTH